jgi:hypothetical protein
MDLTQLPASIVNIIEEYVNQITHTERMELMLIEMRTNYYRHIHRVLEMKLKYQNNFGLVSGKWKVSV